MFLIFVLVAFFILIKHGRNKSDWYWEKFAATQPQQYTSYLWVFQFLFSSFQISRLNFAWTQAIKPSKDEGSLY